jgi:hypothetical protein
MYGATPAEIAAREDWTNQTMAAQDVPFRVCLHPDTTVTALKGSVKRECDYCPAFTVSVFGVPDSPPAWLWPATDEA